VASRHSVQPLLVTSLGSSSRGCPVFSPVYPFGVILADRCREENEFPTSENAVVSHRVHGDSREVTSGNDHGGMIERFDGSSIYRSIVLSTRIRRWEDTNGRCGLADARERVMDHLSARSFSAAAAASLQVLGRPGPGRSDENQSATINLTALQAITRVVPSGAVFREGGNPDNPGTLR